jgi:pyruvate formate lyase activating enzyme
VKKAVLYEKLPADKVRCTACSWYCTIKENGVGICATRANIRGDLYSLVYGRPTTLAVDPVEKKPLYHFLPGSSLLSFGTVGCNFGCEFCQNFDTSQAGKQTGRDIDGIKQAIDRLSVKATPRQIVDLALEKGTAGIAYTYNEPAIFVEFAHDTAKIAHTKGLKNVYVSNGFESKEAFDYMKDLIDAINIDLKSFREEFYRKISHAKIQPVLENIKRFFTAGIATEVTSLIIPGLNDNPGEITDIADFIASVSPDIPWHLSAFYPTYHMLDTPPTPHQTLIDAFGIGIKAGLKYIYVGNVSDAQRSSTYCPKCMSLLIRRLGYDVSVTNLNLTTGRCKNCREKIYGVWH